MTGPLIGISLLLALTVSVLTEATTAIVVTELVAIVSVPNMTGPIKVLFETILTVIVTVWTEMLIVVLKVARLPTVMTVLAAVTGRAVL